MHGLSGVFISEVSHALQIIFWIIINMAHFYDKLYSYMIIIFIMMNFRSCTILNTESDIPCNYTNHTASS